MPNQNTQQAAPVDTLTGMAKLLTDLHAQLDAHQRHALAQRTGLPPEVITTLFSRAETIARTHDAPGENHGRATPLERHLTEPDMFTLTGERALWLGIEDPRRPGRGFDLRIKDAGDGPVIDVWMMNDADIPGADQGPVPYAPIASIGFAYNDHLNPDLDEKLARA